MNLNTFDVMYIEINRYDINGEQIEEPVGALESSWKKCGETNLHAWTDPDRGYSHFDISNITRQIDTVNLQSRLCQDCLDQINSDCFFDSQPAEYAVISFAEKRIRAVTESLRGYGFDTYSVYTEFGDNTVHLLVNYSPFRYH